MNKRLSLLVHEPFEDSYPQHKTTRTELSDQRPQQPCTVSRNSDKSIPQSDLDNSRHKFLQFQQFSNEQQPVYQYQPNLLKKKLNIDVPQSKFEGGTANRSISEKPTKDSKDRTVVKEPPAPSKGSKCQGKVFVFPVAKTNGNTPVIKQPCSIPNITLNAFADPSQPVSPGASSRIHHPQHAPYSPSKHSLLQQIQTYKKDLLIRDSQITLLQKIISDNIQTQHPPSSSFNPPLSYSNSTLQDDLNSQLMCKITELTNTLKLKNQELALYKYENHKMECVVEAMQHEAYIMEKRHQSEIMREGGKRREPSTHWEEDRSSLGVHGHAGNNNVSIKHIEVRKCDKEEEGKKKKVISKTKEEQHIPTVPVSQPSQQHVWYCQTSKHKTKCSAVFDFKQSKENISDIGGAIKKRKRQMA